MDGRFIRTVTHGDQVVVHLRDEIDVTTAAELRARLQELIAAGHVDLVIDLQPVRFIDSTGLGVLVSALKAVRDQEGRVQLVIISESPIARILRISSLDQVFPVHLTLDAALSE